MKFKDRLDFIEIARKSAWKSRYNHDYIPVTEGVMQQWEPHYWVIEAMNVAYTQGLADCKEIQNGK